MDFLKEPGLLVVVGSLVSILSTSDAAAWSKKET